MQLKHPFAATRALCLSVLDRARVAGPGFPRCSGSITHLKGQHQEGEEEPAQCSLYPEGIFRGDATWHLGQHALWEPLYWESLEEHSWAKAALLAELTSARKQRDAS